MVTIVFRCVSRFRGMISTQPGSTPSSSFKIVSLEEELPSAINNHGNDIGPYGDQDDEQIFVQKVMMMMMMMMMRVVIVRVMLQVIPETDVITVRLASVGTRVCEIRSVDGSVITSFCVHECEGSSRMGSRPRRLGLECRILFGSV